MIDAPLYELRQVRKVYQGPAEEVIVLKSLDFIIQAGDSLAILGASGSGKSSLLHLLGALDKPSSGTISFGGRELASLSPREAADTRNRRIGFVFQFHHLLPEFTTMENVAMSCLRYFIQSCWCARLRPGVLPKGELPAARESFVFVRGGCSTALVPLYHFG